MAKEPAVPPVPESEGDPERSKAFQNIELRILDADAKAKENVNREADQRYWLRWLAVGTGLCIIIGMGLLLKHVAHKLMTMDSAGSPAAYVIAVYVAPIVAMTTLSLSLLVAAFRGFKDGDEATGASLAQESAKAAGMLR